MRHLRASVATAALVGALVAPTPASAAQSNYVVTVAPTTGATCERTILEVTMTHDIVPAHIYTETMCAFSAPLSRNAARQVAADPRVVSVKQDSPFTAGGA